MLLRATKERKTKKWGYNTTRSHIFRYVKLKAKCDQMQKVIYIIEKEFVYCIEKAEARNDMSLVIKGNELKRSKQTMGELKRLQNEYEKLDEKRKRLSS